MFGVEDAVRIGLRTLAIHEFIYSFIEATVIYSYL